MILVLVWREASFGGKAPLRCAKAAEAGLTPPHKPRGFTNHPTHDYPRTAHEAPPPRPRNYPRLKLRRAGAGRGKLRPGPVRALRGSAEWIRGSGASSSRREARRVALATRKPKQRRDRRPRPRRRRPNLARSDQISTPKKPLRPKPTAIETTMNQSMMLISPPPMKPNGALS